MKALTAFFGATVAGIVVCLAMTVYTGVKEHQEKNKPVQITIPLPAVESH